MKKNPKLTGILLIVIGIFLCVLEAFVAGLIFVLLGIGYILFSQPAPSGSQSAANPQPRPQPKRNPSGSSDTKPVKKPARPAETVSGDHAADGYSHKGSVDSYFMELFREHFPELRVFRGKRMAGPNDVPVTFLLCRDDAPVLAIILCDSKEYDQSWITNTMQACVDQRIPVQRYYRDFRNEAGYVVKRIRDVI